MSRYNNKYLQKSINFINQELFASSGNKFEKNWIQIWPNKIRPTDYKGPKCQKDFNFKFVILKSIFWNFWNSSKLFGNDKKSFKDTFDWQFYQRENIANLWTVKSNKHRKLVQKRFATLSHIGSVILLLENDSHG